MSNTIMNTGGDQANPVSPKEMLSAAADTVKQEVATFAASAQEKVKTDAEDRKHTATEAMGHFAAAIRRAGDELASRDQSIASKMVRHAADGLEGFSRSVAEKDPEQLLDAARDFGRRNPAALIAGAALIGLAAGRFLRSSATHETRAYGDHRTGRSSLDQDEAEPAAGPWPDTLAEMAAEPDGTAEGDAFDARNSASADLGGPSGRLGS